MPRKRSRIRLIDTDREFAQRQTILIEHHRQLAAALEQQLQQTIATRYRIDLYGEDWSLDVEKGILRREDPALGPTPLFAVPAEATE